VLKGATYSNTGAIHQETAPTLEDLDGTRQTGDVAKTSLEVGPVMVAKDRETAAILTQAKEFTSDPGIEAAGADPERRLSASTGKIAVGGRWLGETGHNEPYWADMGIVEAKEADRVRWGVRGAPMGQLVPFPPISH
jgi:hypothetical protein